MSLSNPLDIIGSAVVTFIIPSIDKIHDLFAHDNDLITCEHAHSCRYWQVGKGSLSPLLAISPRQSTPCSLADC